MCLCNSVLWVGGDVDFCWGKEWFEGWWAGMMGKG